LSGHLVVVPGVTDYSQWPRPSADKIVRACQVPAQLHLRRFRALIGEGATIKVLGRQEDLPDPMQIFANLSLDLNPFETLLLKVIAISCGITAQIRGNPIIGLGRSGV
jgi:hypothetical protein